MYSLKHDGKGFDMWQMSARHIFILCQFYIRTWLFAVDFLHSHLDIVQTAWVYIVFPLDCRLLRGSSKCVVVVVVVAFSSLARIFGEGWTIRSPPVPFFFFFLVSGD